jgi:ribonuclease HI
MKQCWGPPEGDILKINTDDSFFQDSSSGGWGFVIRISLGEVVASASGRIDHARNALQTEAMVCLHAIRTSQDLGITEVEFESDAPILV